MAHTGLPESALDSARLPPLPGLDVGTGHPFKREVRIFVRTPHVRLFALHLLRARRAARAYRRGAVRVDAAHEDVFGRDLGHKLMDARAHPVNERLPDGDIVHAAHEDIFVALLHRRGDEFESAVVRILDVR